MLRFALFQQDATAWLASLPDGSVDLIVTDPAYESLEKHRAIGTTTRLENWFPIFPNSRYPELFAECYRVLKPDSHAYVFCDQETMFVIKPIAEAVGFTFKKPLVWDKKKIGMGYSYRARYEFILFFAKGKRRLNDLSIADVLPFDRIRNGYPTEKPVALNRVLIEQSTVPGQVVADPFMGSGSTGHAALEAGRPFLGNDIESRSIEMARSRMSQIPGATESKLHSSMTRPRGSR